VGAKPQKGGKGARGGRAPARDATPTKHLDGTSNAHQEGSKRPSRMDRGPGRGGGGTGLGPTPNLKGVLWSPPLHFASSGGNKTSTRRTAAVWEKGGNEYVPRNRVMGGGVNSGHRGPCVGFIVHGVGRGNVGQAQREGGKGAWQRGHENMKGRDVYRGSKPFASKRKRKDERKTGGMGAILICANLHLFSLKHGGCVGAGVSGKWPTNGVQIKRADKTKSGKKSLERGHRGPENGGSVGFGGVKPVVHVQRKNTSGVGGGARFKKRDEGVCTSVQQKKEPQQGKGDQKNKTLLKEQGPEKEAGVLCVS